MRENKNSDVTENVKKVLEVFKSNFQFALDLHKVLARLYETAGVELTQAEKAAVLTQIAAKYGEHVVVAHPF
jgi:hypothetical protein